MVPLGSWAQTHSLSRSSLDPRPPQLLGPHSHAHEPPPHSPTPAAGADSLAQMHTKAGLTPWDPQDLWSPQQLSRSPSVPNSQIPPDLALRDISGSQANSLTQWLVHLDLVLTHLLAHLHSLQVLHHGPMDL